MSVEIDIPVISVLARPARDGVRYLLPHHVQAADRIRHLFERSQLQSRVTMHYGPRVSSGRAGGSAADIPDSAADARKRLETVLRSMPFDCRGVVLDVCCFERGLQDIEQERNWPRRSAKLVLRIGLEEGAKAFGLASQAEGPQAAPIAGWMQPGSRPADAT